MAWGTGALGVAVLMNGVSFLVLFYMIGILKIEPALAGALVFATKLIDVASDPIVGLWSDRLKSPRGRRRPFLLFGAVISAVAFALVFSTPVFDEQLYTAMFIFIAMVLYTVGYTLFNVPYMAMPAEMTDSYHERSSIHAYRVIFVTIGGFFAGSIAPWVLEAMGKSEWSSYSAIGIGGAVVILICMSITYFGTAKAPFTTSGVAVPSISAEFKAVLANRHFMRLITVKMLQLLGVAAAGSAMIFFFVNAINLDLQDKSYFFAVVTIASLAAAPLIVKLSKTYGKRNAYLLSAGCTVVYALSWLLAVPNEPLEWVLVRGVIIGIAATGNVVLAMSMLTDTIEFDARKTGVRREGAYTALYSLVEKVTFAFGPLIIGVALSAAGFDQNLPVGQMQSEEVKQALLLGVCYLPAGLGVLTMVVIAGFKLDEKSLAEAGSDPVAAEQTAAPAPSN